MRLYVACQEKERENRLFDYWVAYFNNPFGGKDRKTWEEFYLDATRKTPAPKKMGNISGVDLTKIRK